MSRVGRLGLVAVAVVVVVVAFLVARPDDDDDGGRTSSDPAAAETAPGEPTATAPSAPEPPPDATGRPRPVLIELRDHVPAEGVKSIEVAKGERVRLVVESDAPDDIHVHGYDVERAAAPGKPARFSFPATIEGIFEIESHEAEHHGEEPLIARLVVAP
jgi:hypothetical protein